ncbi:MAG: SurA N-terminal domain-containing protein [Beijerinckiaceae bacterium]|jgi:peptidyl-prolyl cis-trans isomerase D|nr:SurA N-terminal domain-containing protein [Beijerinckiaceae bacterium]
MMMQGIRNAGQTWLGKLLVGILFAILIGSFAIWGIGDIFRGQGRNTVATVGKKEIDIEQVRSAYQNEVQRLSRRFRQNITPDQARALGVDQQVLSRLVTEAALDADAAERGLTVSNEAVAKSILDDQNFRGAAGTFDRNMFNELLRQAGLNEQGYVREQRAAIVRNQLAEALSGQSQAPLAVQEAAHRYRNEQRVIRFVALPPAAVGTIDEPTDAVLRTFFEERKASFRAPEYRTANVLALTPQTLANPGSISEADAVAHYERIKARFGTPERRTVQQIVFPTQAEAAAAAERIRSGTSFEDLARERNISDADLTLGSFTRPEMLDQAVAAAAFALAPNAVSPPVQGAFGYALLRTPLIEAEKVRPFAEVAGEVRNDLALSRAVQSLAEVHDKIEDMRASARPLKDIADEMKLAMVALGPVDRSRQSASGLPLTPVPAATQVIEAMFRADIGTDNEAVRTPDNGYVWFDVSTIEPARERTFDEVRALVASQWRQDEMASRLQAKGREVTDRIAKGETLDTVAAALGLTVETSPPLTRASSLPEFPANVLTVAFGTVVNGAASADLGGERGRMVFQVQTATVSPFLRTTQEAESVGQQLGIAIGDDLLSQYVTALQGRLGVRINQTTLRNATGGGES